MAIKPIKLGLVGAGVISFTYLENLVNTFGTVQVVGISDLIDEKSALRARQFGVRQMSTDEILSDPEIEIVVNLTYPTAHLPVNEAALRAGKHVYCEKMMGVNFDEAKCTCDLAIEKGLRFGQAPDTFLGAAGQTARKLLDAGMIGEPLMAQAMCARGYRIAGAEDVPLRFGYGPGGAMPYDMGGYYIHALVNLLGPVAEVSGFSRIYRTEKPYENPRHPRYKQTVPLGEPGILLGTLKFHGGCIANLSIAADCQLPEVPRLEVYGTEGTLILPDPNHYGGQVLLARGPSGEKTSMPLTHGYAGPLRERLLPDGCEREAGQWARSCRGLGVADMAWAIRNDRPHRCSAELGLHTAEILCGIVASGGDGKRRLMVSRPGRPAPLRSGFVSGTSVDEASLDD